MIIVMLSASADFAYGLSSDGLYWSQKIDILSNPAEYSYEGHRIVLIDISNYMSGYNGLGYLPVEVAESGYVQTRWEGDFRIQKINESVNGSVLAMNVCFDKPGIQEIMLFSTWLKGGEAGNTYYDSHTLDIRDCPAIDKIRFDGEQRAFQRQELNLRLAQNPEYPIKQDSLRLEIRDSSGRLVPYCRPLQIETEAGNEFINLKLEFVTKNSNTELFTYNIFAEDSRGKILNEAAEFTVKEDLAPAASIRMPIRIFRGSDGTAEISAEYNGLDSDDDTLLSWTLPSEADDISFSNDNKKLSFCLARPGEYNISLTVTDIWADTLDEFTSLDPRKSASYTGKLIVDNLAPYLDADDRIKSFDLLLINSDDANLEEMNEAMLEYNINLNIRQVNIDRDQPRGELSYLGQVSIKTRNDLDSTVYYECAHLINDNYYYRLVTLSTQVSINETLYIFKYDLDNPDKAPEQIQIPSDAFSGMNRLTVISLNTDLTGENLYLRVGNETLIMDMQDHSFYPKLSIPIGSTNIAFDNRVYSLCDDGFYLIDLADGKATLINEFTAISSRDQSCRLIFGQAYFCAKKDNKVYQCIINLSSEEFIANELFESSGIIYLLGISPAGKMYFEINNTSSSSVLSFTRGCEELYAPLTLSRQSVFLSTNAASSMAHPVFDASGEINYIYTASNSANYSYFTKMTLWHLSSQSSKAVSCTINKPDLSRPMLGLQLGDGTVLLGLATKYDNAGMQNTAVLMQLTTDGKSAASTVTIDNKSEFQCRGNEYIAVSNTYGNASKISFYKFTEGYQAKSSRISMESLDESSDYMDMTDNFNMENILAKHHISKPGITDVSIYRNIGDVVTLDDFGFSKDNYTDYEQDYPLREITSLSFPFTCTEQGRFVFYFSVIDTTHTGYDRESKKQMGIIYVASDEDDYTDDPIQKPGDENTPGRTNFVLHRKY